MNKIKIKIKDEMRIDGKHVKEGSELELLSQEALYLISTNRAIAVDQSKDEVAIEKEVKIEKPEKKK